jgi:hypothetical protein
MWRLPEAYLIGLMVLNGLYLIATAINPKDLKPSMYASRITPDNKYKPLM